jgi:hypothetical protein
VHLTLFVSACPNPGAEQDDTDGQGQRRHLDDDGLAQS